MKYFLAINFNMKKLTVLIGFSLLCNYSYAQLFTKKVWDIPTMEAQIAHNKKEHKKQGALKDGQAVNSATQTYAKIQGNNFKETVKTIHNRLISLSSLISDGKMLYESYDILKDVLIYQKEIVSTIGNDPKLLPIAFSSQKHFVKRANDLIMYITLIGMSASDLNAMKSTDRRSIVAYIVNELRVIRGEAYGCKVALKWAKQGNYLNSINPWADYVNQDKKLANDILANIKF